MTKPMIEVKNLGKKYRIGEKEKYLALRDKIAHPIKAIQSLREQKDFLALDDVSFTVEPGEVLGVIGRNGAGKSTLLKVLSRITPPTTGEIIMRGRVGSLLEVGTGFHPELTGRENIFLSGSILGMRKKEIEKKFDEIVEFAGVEKFLDTPVKRYSSGMYVRLGFAIAAHLEPEILLIDEVLAVGDAEFQKKCLGKMGDITKNDGRTIIFVSHNMGAVKKLCTRCIFLDDGKIKKEGNTEKVIDYYLNLFNTKNSFFPINIKEIDVVVSKIIINKDNDGRVIPGKSLSVDIEIVATREISGVGLLVMLSHDDTNGRVFFSNTKSTKGMNVNIKKGKNNFVCFIEHFNLCSGQYRFGFGIDIPFVKFYYYDENLFSFDVIETMLEHAQINTSSIYSHVYLDHRWIVKN